MSDLLRAFQYWINKVMPKYGTVSYLHQGEPCPDSYVRELARTGEISGHPSQTVYLIAHIATCTRCMAYFAKCVQQSDLEQIERAKKRVSFSYKDITECCQKLCEDAISRKFHEVAGLTEEEYRLRFARLVLNLSEAFEKPLIVEHDHRPFILIVDPAILTNGTIVLLENDIFKLMGRNENLLKFRNVHLGLVSEHFDFSCDQTEKIILPDNRRVGFNIKRRLAGTASSWRDIKLSDYPGLSIRFWGEEFLDELGDCRIAKYVGEIPGDCTREFLFKTPIEDGIRMCCDLPAPTDDFYDFSKRRASDLGPKDLFLMQDIKSLGLTEGINRIIAHQYWKSISGFGLANIGEMIKKFSVKELESIFHNNSSTRYSYGKMVECKPFDEFIEKMKSEGFEVLANGMFIKDDVGQDVEYIANTNCRVLAENEVFKS